MNNWIKVKLGHRYHDFSSLLFSQYEAECVGVGSSHQTKEQRLLGVHQLTHIHCNTHKFSLYNTCSHQTACMQHCGYCSKRVCINRPGTWWKDGCGTLTTSNLQKPSERQIHVNQGCGSSRETLDLNVKDCLKDIIWGKWANETFAAAVLHFLLCFEVETVSDTAQYPFLWIKIFTNTIKLSRRATPIGFYPD